MNIKQLEIGKEYRLIHAYGQPDQKVKVLNVKEKCSSAENKYWSASIIYTSNDCTKGMRTSMNTLECERYLHQLL